MKLGLAYPSTEITADREAVRRFVCAAEDLGFTHLMAYDHVLKCPQEGRTPPLAGPYTEKDAFHDPFVLFGFAAALTERIEFVSGVMVLPQRQTALVAQQAADVDLLSCERLRLGVGVGWNHVEYAGLGQDFRPRGARIEEQVGLLRRLWSEPVVSFEGRFDRIDRAGINPRPRRRIPLWMGGNSEAAYARGARIGDGFIFAGAPAGAAAAWNFTRARLAEFGREEAPFGRELLAIFGRSPAETADHLRAWRQIGGTHGCVATTGLGLGDDVEAHLAYASEVKRLLEAA